MWTGLVVGIFSRPWARQAVAIALVALTIALFIFNLRRAAERAGRAAERLDQLDHIYAIHRQIWDAVARRPRGRDELLDRVRNGGL